MQFHQRLERQGKQPINIWASNIWTEKNHYPVTFITALCLKYDSLRLFPLPSQFLRGVSLPPASGSTLFGLKIRASLPRGGYVAQLPPASGSHTVHPGSQPPLRHHEGRGSPDPSTGLKPGEVDLCPAAEMLNQIIWLLPRQSCRAGS